MESLLLSFKTEEKGKLSRCGEILFAMILIIVTFPLFLAGCLISFLDLKENPIFSQIRVGKNGKLFSILKIKTISSVQKRKVSFLGKLLRKTKIDELPQLFNVFIGDMRIIGPRPEQPQYVEQFLKQTPSFSLRHKIKPGITGLAQVCLPRATPKDNLKKLEHDLYYVNNHSLKLDCIILLKTLKIILTLDSN
ncbi:sugar transferase [Tenacibaculum xiamenense]|uniref:sugar transferase n=1 Tax=Tenacibaculum xiamenense TaxID=1261553 RepID=UPI003895B340